MTPQTAVKQLGNTFVNVISELYKLIIIIVMVQNMVQKFSGKVFYV